MIRSIRLAMLLFRALCFAVIAFPALADETLAPVDAVAQQLIPPPVALPETTDAASAPAPFVGDACAPNYWIVSSRNSVQTIHQRCSGPWGLNVYHRTPDGRLSETNLASMQSQLDPNVPVCVFVHGSFVLWESQCAEAHDFYLKLRQASSCPLQVIFFTWPSDAPYTYCFWIDVMVRGKRADFNGFHLSHLVSRIPESCPVSFIGHSHGSRVVLSMLHMAGGGTIDGHVFPYSTGQRRYRVVLAAGAMDHDWLNPGEHFEYALNPVECLLNLQNRKDLPLAFYPLHRPSARRAVARSGFTNRDIERLGYNGPKVRDHDVTEYVQHSHFWPEYYKHPNVVAALVPYVYFY